MERKAGAEREHKRVLVRCENNIETEMVSQHVTKGFGGQVGYLRTVLCRFPPAKLSYKQKQDRLARVGANN